MKKLISLAATLMLSLATLAQDNIYGFTVKDFEGKEVSLNKFKGKVLLIVNTATKCGYTPQYGDLEELYKKYGKDGLEVLNFPCNQFGEQAPGSDASINEFCVLTYNTTYPQFAKVEVNGENEAPLFAYIKDKKNYVILPEESSISKLENVMYVGSKDEADGKPDIYWNFTKFLVNKEGKVMARFESKADKETLEPAIKELLK